MKRRAWMLTALALAACKEEAKPKRRRRDDDEDEDEEDEKPSKAKKTAPKPSEPHPESSALALEVAVRDRHAELALTQWERISEATDTNKLLGRPNQYVIKYSWKAHGKNATAEFFRTLEDTNARAAYVRDLGKKAPMFLQYVYVNERHLMVLRVDKDLTPDQARKWELITASL